MYGKISTYKCGIIVIITDAWGYARFLISFATFQRVNLSTLLPSFFPTLASWVKHIRDLRKIFNRFAYIQLSVRFSFLNWNKILLHLSSSPCDRRSKTNFIHPQKNTNFDAFVAIVTLLSSSHTITTLYRMI